MGRSLTIAALVSTLTVSTTSCSQAEGAVRQLAGTYVSAPELEVSSLRRVRHMGDALFRSARRAVRDNREDTDTATVPATLLELPAAPSPEASERREEPHAAEPPPDAQEAAADSVPVLSVVGNHVNVFAQPNVGATKLGYLRFGAIVRVRAERVHGAGCSGGWYRIAPEGYVCRTRQVTIGSDHPLIQAVRAQPDRTSPLPYEYALARGEGPPVYRRLPTVEEQRQNEHQLVRSSAPPRDWTGIPFLSTVPEPLAEAGEAAFHGRAAARSAFAFVAFFEESGRHFGLTPDLKWVPVNRVRKVTPSGFHGMALNGDVTLPVAFVRSARLALYTGAPRAGLTVLRTLQAREAVAVSGRRERVGSKTYLETREGAWLLDEHVVLVEPRANVPRQAHGGKWIDVSINRQTLVAYEGARPVFATLVSTGSDGLGDPLTTRSTVLGEYRIHTKHVSSTMDSDVSGDEYEMHEVPYVQYFTGGYALHAAYWHDGFGTPRSHGCINLSPADARYLFHWTDPPVPQGWHAAFSLREGTLIDVHP